jgi:hypothetical protein
MVHINIYVIIIIIPINSTFKVIKSFNKMN